MQIQHAQNDLFKTSRYVVTGSKDSWIGKGPIWTHPFLKAGVTRAGYSGLCLAGFWVSQNRLTPKHLWTASFWIQQLSFKKDLICSGVTSCISFCPIAFCSLTEYHWKEHSSTVCSLFRWSHTLVRFPWSFSSPAEQSQLSLSLLLCQILQSLCLCGPSLQFFLYVCVSFVLWSPQLDTTLHAVFSPLLRKREVSSPLGLLVMLPLVHPRMLLATSAVRAQR